MTKTTFKYERPKSPDIPADASKPVVAALHALMDGNATEHQQKLALNWIINEASAPYGVHYYPDQDGRRNTDFALGRAFVGQQIIGLLKIDLLKIIEEDNRNA